MKINTTLVYISNYRIVIQFFCVKKANTSPIDAGFGFIARWCRNFRSNFSTSPRAEPLPRLLLSCRLHCPWSPCGTTTVVLLVYVRDPKKKQWVLQQHTVPCRVFELNLFLYFPFSLQNIGVWLQFFSIVFYCLCCVYYENEHNRSFRIENIAVLTIKHSLTL